MAAMDQDISTNTQVGKANSAISRNDDPILEPGRNCWRIEKARRAAILIDGEAYFERLHEVLASARHRIFIIGWDFDGRINLRPQAGMQEKDQLGPFLGALAKARPDLEITILIWSTAILHGTSSTDALLVEHPWLSSPNIRLKLDTAHPIHGAHHQKLVAVDDAIAFAGGIDLTAERWDSEAHHADDRRRLNPAGKPYGPVHDLQMIVDGDAAQGLGDVARWRWQRATGERIAPVQRPVDEPCAVWPDGLAPDFTDVAIAIARTAPAFRTESPIHESAALLRDTVASARDALYIETQYLANFEIGDLLIRHLDDKDGPEIVIVVTRTSRGVVEHLAMGSNRNRLTRRLLRADRHGRLRVFYRALQADDHKEQPGAKDDDVRQVLIHTKLVIADDRLLRLGSANINYRSQGLDTECDLAIEARDEATRKAIAALRARLVAHHLGIDASVAQEEIVRTGSLIHTIEALDEKGRLRGFEIDPRGGSTAPMPGTRLVDPKRPFEPLWWLRRSSQS